MNQRQLTHNKIATFFIISFLIIFAAILRISTFYLPHDNGDQGFYLSLAMKLDAAGLADYNLHGVDRIAGQNGLLAVLPAKVGQKGSVLTTLENNHIFYYSKEKLSNMPPAFSTLIMLSHRMFKPDELYVIVMRNLGPFAIIFRPEIYLNAQFYAVWINFMFSILLILLTFFLGKALFHENVGLWAAMLMAVSPVDILTSQRLWPDEMAACFVSLSIFLYWLGKTKTKKSLIFFLASGVSAGIAALSKPSGAFVIPVLIMTDFLISWTINKKTTLRLLFNIQLISIVLCALLVCGFWYLKIASVYGVPWYQPHQEGIEKVARWFIYLAKKPLYGQLYYFVYLVPLLGCFYWEAARTLIKRIISSERILCLAWFTVFTLLLMLFNAKEERYMLPAYPAIAIFTAIVIERIKEKYNAVNHLGDVLVMLIILFTSMWSIGIGLKTVFDNQSILFSF